MKPLSSLLALATLAFVGASAVKAASSAHAERKAPALQGSGWLNTEKPQSLKGLAGKVVLLHFWTFECINCRHNLPVYAALNKEFKGGDVTMIGIHTPETANERSFNNVAEAIKRLGITYPVLVDRDGKNWDAYGVTAWPTLFVIDKQGRIRGQWVGELNYNGADGQSEVEALVKKLKNEK